MALIGHEANAEYECDDYQHYQVINIEQNLGPGSFGRYYDVCEGARARLSDFSLHILQCVEVIVLYCQFCVNRNKYVCQKSKGEIDNSGMLHHIVLTPF